MGKYKYARSWDHTQEFLPPGHLNGALGLWGMVCINMGWSRHSILSLFIFRRFAGEEKRLQVMFFLWAALMHTYDSHGKFCSCFISSVLPICMIVGLQKILDWLLVSYLVYLKCHIHSRINNLVQLAKDPWYLCKPLKFCINKKKYLSKIKRERNHQPIPMKE